MGKNVAFAVYSSWSNAKANHLGIINDPKGFTETLQELFGVSEWGIEALLVRAIKKHFSSLRPAMVLEATTFVSLIREIRTKAVSKLSNDDSINSDSQNCRKMN